MQANAPQSLPQPEEVHLQDYINVIRRRRWTFFITFLTVFTGVALYTFLVSPLYEATATLHIKDQKSKSGILGELALSEVSPIDSEIEILKSRTNVEQVVKQAHLDWQVKRKSQGLSFKLLEFTSTAKASKYRIEVTGNDTFNVYDDDEKMVGTGKSGTLMKGDGITLLLNDLRGKAGDGFRLKLLSFQRTVQRLRNNLKAVESGKKTNVIQVSYRNNDSALASDVVNTLIRAYLDKTVALNAEEASRTEAFTDEQIKGVRDDLEKAEQNLQQYKSASGVVKLDSEADELIKKFSEAEKEKAGVVLLKKQMEFALASLREAARKGTVYSPVTPAVLNSDPSVTGMATKLADLEVQKRALSSEYTKDYQSVKSIQVQIDEMQRKIQSNFETSVRNLSKEEGDIGRRLAGYEALLKKMPASERDLARLTRLAKVNADTYTFLLQKHEEARIAKASTMANINIVDPAIVTDDPVKPQKLKNIILGLLVGCMLGVGLAFFREYFDDTVKDADTAKQRLGYPILSIIPYIKPSQTGGGPWHPTLITHRDPRCISAESFRTLRTSIHFSVAGEARKVILITSTFPGEGKTTMVANLAVALSQAGKRVMVLDCDLRRPALHAMFGQSQSPGLSSVLAGDITVEQAVHKTDIPRLDFISSGITPPNPLELLGSQRMRDLLERLKECYDVVLIDAPPVLAVSDAPVLTSLADLILVVLEVGRVPVKLALRTKEILSSTGVSVAGIILNDRDGKGEGYGYYGSGYCSYGYGYEEKVKKGRWRKFFSF